MLLTDIWRSDHEQYHGHDNTFGSCVYKGPKMGLFSRSANSFGGLLCSWTSCIFHHYISTLDLPLSIFSIPFLCVALLPSWMCIWLGLSGNHNTTNTTLVHTNPLSSKGKINKRDIFLLFSWGLVQAFEWKKKKSSFHINHDNFPLIWCVWFDFMNGKMILHGRS